MVAAARETRDRLRRAGLRSFVRLSGGKGLHVVVPIARGPSWDAVRAFCDAFADAMAEHAPERYVATMSKAKRPGKIFIDWLRNTRGATRSEEHTSELQSLMRISYAVFCLKKKKQPKNTEQTQHLIHKTTTE